LKKLFCCAPPDWKSEVNVPAGLSENKVDLSRKHSLIEKEKMLLSFENRPGVGPELANKPGFFASSLSSPGSL